MGIRRDDGLAYEACQ